MQPDSPKALRQNLPSLRVASFVCSASTKQTEGCIDRSAALSASVLTSRVISFDIFTPSSCASSSNIRLVLLSGYSQRGPRSSGWTGGLESMDTTDLHAGSLITTCNDPPR